MAGMRDYTDAEIELVRQSFGGRYALRDRCYFEMALQMGLRVSEMLSIRVGQVYQYGRVVDEVSIDRKHMKGGKAGKASGRTLPIFAATKPHILTWLQRLAGMLKVQDISDIPSDTPLFMSRVRNPNGSRRAITQETAWRIIKAIARENELPGAVGTHSTRKTLARKAMAWAKDIRVVQKLLGHKSLQSTEAYLKSLTDREVWSAFQTAIAAAQVVSPSDHHALKEGDTNREDASYVYLDNGTFVNAEIIRQGYGFAYTRFPFKYLEEFRQLEREAREAERGLWGRK